MELTSLRKRWPAAAPNRFFVRIAGAALLAVLILSPAVQAQQSGGAPPNEAETVAELLKRVQHREARLKQIEEERAKNAAPATPAAPAEAAQANVPPAPAAEPEPGMGMPEPGPHLQIRGFSDVTLHGSNEKDSPTAFSLGQLDLFITSEISERFKILSEIVFEADETNALGVDVERLMLQYSHNDYFKMAVGRYHTAIGFYNTAYHHSSWLQTAIGRPFLFEFEDEGGILPIHNVGVSASGRIPSGTLDLRYVAELGNGRASRSPLDQTVQNGVDENDHKAFDLTLLARPESVPGLQAGFSVYRDVLIPDGSPRIGETILSMHAVYLRPGFEWLNEALVIRHALLGQSRVFHTPGGYTQISRGFGSYRPFFRYEYINAPSDEPIFSDVGLRHGPSAGLRFDANDAVALKFQYDHTMQRARPAFGMLTLQFAFTF